MNLVFEINEGAKTGVYKIVFVGNRTVAGGGTSGPELWIMDADGSNAHQVTNFGAASFARRCRNRSSASTSKCHRANTQSSGSANGVYRYVDDEVVNGLGVGEATVHDPDTLTGLEHGLAAARNLQARPQPTDGVSHAPKVTVDDARVDWSASPIAFDVDLSIRDLPPAHKAAWQSWFDLYVFGPDAGEAAPVSRPA